MNDVTIITEDGDQTQVINTAPTTPVAASSVTVQFTKNLTDASGLSQQITGVGFTPRLIMFMNGISGQNMISNGWASILGVAITQFCQDMSSLGNFYQPYAIIARDPSNVTSNFQTAVVQAFGPDGFTLMWTKAGTPLGTESISAVCFR